MIQPLKDETSKVGQFRAQVNKWIAKNKYRGCSQFQQEVSKLNEIYRLLVARQFASIKERYDVDYLGFLNLCCKHPSAKNAWIHQKCLLPFEIKIQDYMETCADTLHRIQHIESPANKFSWDKKFGFISSNISVSYGKFSSNLDDKTMVVCQGVTDASGNLFSGRLRFFGDRIHSTLEPHRLCEFPKLQTKYYRLISSSMISAQLRDDKGNQLYTKIPIKVIQKVPDMINNQTARTFKKFVFDPVDGVWVEKPGLIFNEGNRTFEYQFDTIDSLGPVYVDDLMKRFVNLPKPQEKPIVKHESEQDIKLKFKIQVYESVEKTFGHETYLPKCLRQKYVEVFLRQPIETMYLYQERMALIQVEGRRFYFVPQNYQLRVVSAELETDPSDANRWNQSILLHNEDSKTKAEEAGFLSIDLASFTFTRKQNAQKISIFSDFFKEISSQGNLVHTPSIQQAFTDKLQQKTIAFSKRSILKSISDIPNLIFPNQAQPLKKLIEQITLQTVFIAERRYHMHLINYLLQSIDYKNKNTKIASVIIGRRTISRAKIIEEEEKKRLLKELQEMRPYCNQKIFQNNENRNLQAIENEHSNAFGNAYNEQFNKQAKQILKSWVQDGKASFKNIKELYKEVFQCISFLKGMKSLRGGGGVPFQRLLVSLGNVCSVYKTTMQTDVTLNTQRVQMVLSAISLNAQDALIDDNSPFTSIKTLLQRRSVSLSAFMSRQSFNTPDDDLLRENLPFNDLRFIALFQQETNYIKKEAIRLIEEKINIIIDCRVSDQRIDQKINAAFQRSGLSKFYLRSKASPKYLSDYNEVVTKSVRSRMGSQDFWKKCKKFIVEKLQNEYRIEINLSKEYNIKSLDKKISEIYQEFKKSQDYKIKWQDRIESYFRSFSSLESTFRSFIIPYTNTDGITFYKIVWTTLTPPPIGTLFRQNFDVILKDKSENVRGYYINRFIVNDKGKIITQIANDLAKYVQEPQQLLKKQVQQNKNWVSHLASQEKDVKEKILKNHLLVDLVEKFKQQQIYQGPVNRKRQPIDILDIGQLSQDQQTIVKQTFVANIKPILENGNIIANCQNKIPQIGKEIQKDKLILTKIIVDKQFHEDTIKNLQGIIKIFEQWIKDAANLQRQYLKLSDQFDLIISKGLEAQYSRIQKYSQQLQKKVYQQNSQLKYFKKKVVEYNKKTTIKLKQAKSIDKQLFKMDFNKIKIQISLESIKGICIDVRTKADRLMNCVVQRTAGQENAIQELRKSLQALEGVQLNNIANQISSFNTTIDSLRAMIRSAMQGNELNSSQLRQFQKNLHTIMSNVHQMKKLNKFIDPR